VTLTVKPHSEPGEGEFRPAHAVDEEEVHEGGRWKLRADR
jgi:hypothetical protein